jgi:tetraacyldisaccharide 4'-kinase
LPVPVIVVGNLIVGGTGKTPLIIHLAAGLYVQGKRPGIISRGYRGAAAQPMAVTSLSDPAIVGDEPLLLAKRTMAPVYVGRDRVAAGCLLLTEHPECDVILSDDGLQHYALARDLEIAVFDDRGAMNGWLLPAGPLREPVSRLQTVDAVVCNGAVAPLVERFVESATLPVFVMHLGGRQFYRLDDPQTVCTAADFSGKKLCAVAGIGNPQRFFSHLRQLGLSFSAHAFPDHHQYEKDELMLAGDAILTTEKDAVKLAMVDLPLPVWVLPVTAQLTPDIVAFITRKLNGYPVA